MALNSERFQFEKFKFWCHKVLPLVYDDSLSYYEVLCKIYDYLNKLIDEVLYLEEAIELLKKYIDEYFDNLDLQEEVNNFLSEYVQTDEFRDIVMNSIGANLVNESKYSLFAQVIPDSDKRFDLAGSQGFCIGRYNGRPVAMNCFIGESGQNDDNIVVWTDLLNGMRINKIELNAGHSNSCCYCPENDHWYIACGGGGSARKSILELDITGSFYNEILPNNDGCWAVTCNNGYIYALANTGHYIYKFKYDDVTNVERIYYDYTSDFTGQGMFSDDKYLYMVRGNTITTTTEKENNQNKIAVYSHTGKFIKLINVLIPVEVEECDIYDGVCYASANTTHIAVLFKLDLYANKAVNYLGRDDNNIVVIIRARELYFDETYSDFFADGTENKPLSSLALICLYVNNAITRINVHIKSDINQLENLTIRLSGNYIISIDAENHKICNITTNVKELYIANALIRGRTGSYSIEYHGSRLVLNSITFGEVDSDIVPSRLVFSTASYEIYGVTINQSAEFMFYMIGEGNLRSVTVNTDALYKLKLGVCSVSSNFPIESIDVQDAQNISFVPIRIIDYNTTIDMNKVNYPCNIIHYTGGTLTNIPESVDLSILNLVECRFVRTVDNPKRSIMINTYYMNDGTFINERRVNTFS